MCDQYDDDVPLFRTYRGTGDGTRGRPAPLPSGSSAVAHLREQRAKAERKKAKRAS